MLTVQSFVTNENCIGFARVFPSTLPRSHTQAATHTHTHLHTQNQTHMHEPSLLKWNLFSVVKLQSYVIYFQVKIGIVIRAYPFNSPFWSLRELTYQSFNVAWLMVNAIFVYVHPIQCPPLHVHSHPVPYAYTHTYTHIHKRKTSSHFSTNLNTCSLFENVSAGMVAELCVHLSMLGHESPALIGWLVF